MVDLRGFEYYAITGNPVDGATVTIREASLLFPNPNPIAATATTNSAGMWEATGLPEAAYDTEVTISNKVWRHKGMSKLSLTGMYIAGSPYQAMNWVRNGGLEQWVGGVGPQVLSTTPTAALAAPFIVSIGTGSSGTLSRETSITAAGSTTSAKVVYTHSSGQYLQSYTISGDVLSGLRGKTLVAQAAVRQGAASQCAVRIYDGTTTTTGSRSATTGSFITLSASAAIPTTATTIRVDVIGDVTGTFYIDNIMLAIGTNTGQFIPHALDQDGHTSYLSATFITDLTVTGATVLGGTVTAPRYTSNIATGTSPFAVTSTTVVTNLNADLLDGLSSAAFAQLAAASNFTTAPTINGGTIWHSGNDGAGSGLDADLLDGLSSLAFLKADGTVVSTGALTFANNRGVNIQNSAAAAKNAIAMDGSNNMLVGDTTNTCPLFLYGSVDSGPIYAVAAGTRTMWHSGNDGAGSGLDADLLDGLSSLAFVKADGTVSMTGTLTTSAAIHLAGNAGVGRGKLYDAGGALTIFEAHNNQFGIYTQGTAQNLLLLNTTTISHMGNTVWHAGNDGAGSGLDADLLDGISSTGYLRIGAMGATAQSLSFNHPGFGTGAIGFGTDAGNVIGGGSAGLDGLAVHGDFAVDGGKARFATGKDGSTAFFHAQESPDPYFTDHGRSRTLSNGTVRVQIPDDYLNHVLTDDYYVNLTARGPASLYITHQDHKGFVVATLAGDSEVEFDWCVTAPQSDLVVDRLTMRRRK